MHSVGTADKILFEQQWQGRLSEYVTTVAWSPDGRLATSSAAGEVVLWQGGNLLSLLPAGLESIDCLDFSSDGKFLAAGGQDGKVRVWSILDASVPKEMNLIATLDNSPKWVDRLAWSPTNNHLAFSLGRYVKIWDVATQTVIATLPFANSSVLDLAWRPNGENLAIAGNGGVKIWSSQDWDKEPSLIDIPSTSTLITWSGDSEYIASVNLDNTIRLLEYGTLNPWIMQGFPGKVSNLAWSLGKSSTEPLLAASSLEIVAVWEKESGDEDVWDARGLDYHQGKVQVLKFNPHSLLLASAGDDGYLCLWSEAQQLGQILEGTEGGFSCLAWSQDGKQLAAGGQDGELIVWSESELK